jgi:hypothetical protein
MDWKSMTGQGSAGGGGSSFKKWAEHSTRRKVTHAESQKEPEVAGVGKDEDHADESPADEEELSWASSPRLGRS